MDRSRPVPSLRTGVRTTRPGLPPSTLFTLGVASLLVGIEAAARLTTTDIADAVLLLALVLVGLLVRLRNAREPVPWVRPIGSALKSTVAWVRRETVEQGVDLRGHPEVRPGFPPLFGGFLGALCVLTVLLTLLPGLNPAALREVLRPVLALSWLAALGAAWLLFLGGGMYLAFMAGALLHDEFVRAWTGHGKRPRRLEWLCVGLLPVAILLAMALLPPWLPALLTALVLGIVATALLLPGTGDVSLLWRAGPGIDGLRSTRWTTTMLGGTSGIGLTVAASVLFVHGSGLRSGASPMPHLPLTAALATWFGWTGLAAVMAWTSMVLQAAMVARFRDPAAPATARVRLEGALPKRDREVASVALTAARMQVLDEATPARPTDVRLVLDGEPGEHRDGALHMATGDLLTEDGIWRVRRRDEIQRRRLLLRGLEGLFKRAAARQYQAGTGFWVAPHFWFCIGLSRDEDEPGPDTRDGTIFLETIGPAYHHVLSQPVRHHLHRVLADLEVDLVFVEDGVGFRRLRRVLRTLFEVHDMHGGRRRAEERHLTGLPGVRCMIHDVEMDEPSLVARRGYPEPDYETIGRARILHVFRDRGEEQEPVDAPVDITGEPILAW